MTCKKCALQYVGSSITKFRLTFNNHNHFNNHKSSGLSDVKIQLIDQVNDEEQLRENEGQWAYRLKTLVPNGLNDNDFFFVQNRRSRRT